MEPRDLFFEIEVTKEQWDELRRTAAVQGADRGYDQVQDEPTTDIAVFVTADRGPSRWRPLLVSDGRTYGPTHYKVAHFHWNDGRPFASIDLPPTIVDEPAFTDQQEQELQDELEDWVRNRWHELMRLSGLHYERGHIPESGSEEDIRYR
ncbi:MAG: hypothetical protein IRZ00_02060 [Gemmatimonadetes bacterium]|nr:hypothetical protein [Gemmatimonadota bacterium]